MKLTKTLIAAMTLSASAFAEPLLKPDEKLVIETLPNGFTVAVYKNSEPPNRVSMRLLVKRGSVYETERERGLAHFLEHMAFNGTKHFPSGDMVEYFQRLGMAFGADTNAHTGFSETVYKIDMPEVSHKLVNDGLTLLRDYADSMILSPEAVEKERGVIIAEKNSRDTPDYRRAVKEIAHYFKGSVYADRMPIGLENVVRNAKPEDFKNFYRATYRPETCVLVVVGDVDAKAVIDDAKTVFGDFSADPSVPAREAKLGTLETSDEKFSFDGGRPDFDSAADCTANASRSYASIAVSKQSKDRTDSYQRRAEDIRTKVLCAAITARFLRVADRPDSKISQGSAGSFEFDKYCDSFVMTAEAPVGKAFDALEENFRQLLSLQNLSDAEILNAKKKIFEILESEIKAEPTRKNQQLADDIASALSDELVFNSPSNDMEIARAALKDFDAKAACALLKKILDNSRIKIFVSDAAAEPSKKQLDQGVDRAFKNAVASLRNADEFASSALVFSKFARAGKIAERREIGELKITQIRFENGVRLNVKKTDFSKDEVLMKISFGRGLLDIPVGRPEYFTAVNALVAGGTKFQTVGEINAAKYLMKVDISAGIDGNSFSVTSSGSAKDFPQAARLAATMIADAGFRDDGAEALRKYAEAFYLDYRTNPMSQLKFLSMRLIKTPIAKVPGTMENFEKISMPEIAAWLRPVLEKSYMEISVVGDVEVESVVRLFAQTFGAMPPRRADNPDAFAPVELVCGGEKIEMTYETTDEPRSVAAKIWRSAGRKDVRKMRADNVLGAVLDDILRKDIREAEGKVYSPFAYNNASTWIDDAGFMSAMTFVVPQYNAELLEQLEACAQKVKASISTDEFERAKIPLIKAIEAGKRKNSYWLEAVLNLSQCKPVNIELAKTIDAGYADITLADVETRAKEIFSQKPCTASVMPVELKSDKAKKELKK